MQFARAIRFFCLKIKFNFWPLRAWGDEGEMDRFPLTLNPNASINRGDIHQTQSSRVAATAQPSVNEPLHLWTWRQIQYACEWRLWSNKPYIECIQCLYWAVNAGVLIHERAPEKSQVENWYICYGCQEMWGCVVIISASYPNLCVCVSLCVRGMNGHAWGKLFQSSNRHCAMTIKKLMDNGFFFHFHREK